MSLDRPLITFGIPFYSNLPYLKRAMDSVLKQSHTNWSLIVCDDCNEKESAKELVESYQDTRVSYFRNERNLGLAGNWNRLFDLTQTDLITLLHADDELLPNYALTMLELYHRHPEAAAYFCRAKIIDESSQEKFSFPDYIKKFLNPSETKVAIIEGDVGLGSLLKGNYVMCPTICYHHPKIKSLRFDARWSMVLDLDFLSRMLLQGNQLVGTSHVAYAYRRHTQNQTTLLTSNLKRFEEEIAIYEHLATVAQDKGWVSTQQQGRRKTMIFLHLAYLTVGDLLKARLLNAWKKLQMIFKMRKPSKT